MTSAHIPLQLESLPPSVAPVLPSEWVDELRGYDPRSHEYQQLAGTLGELAAEQGLQLDLAAFGEQRHMPPPPEGYRSMEVLPDYQTHIPVNQFDGTIRALDRSEPVIATDVTQLITDANVTMRLCDLRPFMSSQVRKGGPSQSAEIKRLDDLVRRDLKFRAETGRPRNTVATAPKVAYTKTKGKMRAYWMVVEDPSNTSGAPTFARLADCGNSEAAQSQLYRELFGQKYDAKT